VSERVQDEVFREDQRLTDGRMLLIKPAVRQVRAIYAAKDAPGLNLLLQIGTQTSVVEVRPCVLEATLDSPSKAQMDIQTPPTC
jgi:hypothetical protein